MTEKEKAIIAAAEAHIGDPYVFGAWGGRCTPAYRQQYAGYNPSHASAIYKACPVLSDRAESCAGCKWREALAFDCRGFTYWCIKTATGFALAGGGASSQYRTAANWADKGMIRDLPDGLPDAVLCLFRMGDSGKMIHTGLYIGGGEVIHCSVTVKREPLSAGKWTHWARPACLADGWKPEKGETVKRALVKGNRGDDVAELQAGLNQLGYDCGTVDGIFGQKTLAAVKAFQATHELTVDGVAGPKTQAALLAALEEDKDDPGDRFTATLTGLTLAQADAVRRDWPDAVIVLEE